MTSLTHNQLVTDMERALDSVVGQRVSGQVFPEVYDLASPFLARKYGLVAEFATDVNALASEGNILYAFTLDSGQAHLRAVNLLTSPLSFTETIALSAITNAVRAATVGPDGAFYLATDTRIWRVALDANRGPTLVNLAAIPNGGIDSIVTIGQRMFAFTRTLGKIYDLARDGSTSAERDYPDHLDADQAGKAAFVYNHLVYHAGNDGIIWRIRDIYNDPIGTDRYVATLPITDNPQAAAVTQDGSAYLVLGNRKLYRINPRTGAVDSEYPDGIAPAYAYIAAGLNAFSYPFGVGREIDRLSAIRNAIAMNRLRGTRAGLDLLAVQSGMSFTLTYTPLTTTQNPRVNFNITYPGIRTLPVNQRDAWLVWMSRMLTYMLPQYYDLGTVNASA